MKRRNLPETAFIDPTGGNRQAVEALFQEAAGRLVSMASTAAQRPPMPRSRDPVAAEIPEIGRSDGDLLNAVEALATQSMNPAHPGYIGHMDSIPATMSAIGEMAAAVFNNNMLSLEMSPALSWLEVALADELRDLFGLGGEATGVLTSGGSLANLAALTVARNRVLSNDGRDMFDAGYQPVVFASTQARTSVPKAAMILGLGPSSVVPIEVDARLRMKPAALDAAVDTCRADGRIPVAIAATAGTTVTGSIDPLADIAEVAAMHDVWLHVDAANGGALLFSPREAGRLDGIGAADSVTFNPQKWLYVAKTCAAVMFRDGTRFKQLFRVGAPYTADTDGFVNLGELSLQGTRHAEALKLWLTLQHIGRAGFAALIGEGNDPARQSADELASRPGIVLACRPDSNIVCFRLSGGVADDKADYRRNQMLQETLLAESEIFLSLPLVVGRRWLRVVLLNPYTDRQVVARLLEAIDNFRMRPVDP